MPITFAVDDVTPAPAPPHTVPFASTVKGVLALGGDAEMRVLPGLATHPLLGAVHRAFAEHRPLVLSPDAVWLTIAQGLARHIRLNADSLRHRLVRHEGRKRLEVSWNGAFPEEPSELARLMDRFREALASEIGEGPARFFRADFTTSTEVEKTASDIILLDAYASFFDYFVGIVCGIPTITLTGTPEDWRSIRARIEVLDELVQGTKIEGWSRGLRIITSKLVEASEGHADRAFFQRIYKPKKAYGSDRITGWVAWFYPYLKRAGRCDVPNGLLAFAPDESLPGEEESEPDAWWTGHGIALTSVPAELSQCLLRVSDHVRDVRFDVTLRGGIACVAVEGEALVPRSAWWCEKGEPSIDEILDEITSKHAFEAPVPPGEFDGGSATILALRARVSSFNIGNGAFTWLPKPRSLVTAERTILSVYAKLADGSLVASMRGPHETVWVRLNEASLTIPDHEWEEATSSLAAVEIPVIAKSLPELLRAAIDGRVGDLPALSSLFPHLWLHEQMPQFPITFGRRVIEPDVNIALAPRTTLGLGGAAKYLVEVNAEHELNLALTWAEERALPVFILGGGSNLLVADAGFDGLVIAMNTRGMATMRSENAKGEACMRITVAAGEPWDAFVAHTVAQGWQGLECLSGIPGLVGATPVQNVGAYGQEVSDTIVSVLAFDRTLGHARWLTPEECEFAYRDSALKRAGARYIVQSVTFELRLNAPPALRYAELQKALSQIEKPTLQETRDRVIALRKAKSMVYDTSDVNHRSAGSFFTNPIVSLEVAQAVMARAKALGIEAEVPQWKTQDGRIKLAAGWLIERAGVQKGLRLGNVGVSTAHSLALVHHGGGTTSELLALADEVKRRVREAFGVELEREPVQMA